MGSQPGFDGGLRLSVLFPTLLGEADLPESEPINRELAAYVRHREQSDRDYSAFTTVNRGWQSGLDFLDVGIPAVQALRRFINQQIESFMAEWGRVSFGSWTPHSFRYSFTGWAVILRQGGFQHEHVHSQTDLVGVYYVEIPQAAPDVPVGSLTLTDPRGGRLASRSVWESAQVSIRPEPGRLILFPSFLPHRVDQVLAPGDRISINLDVTFQGSSNPRAVIRR